MILLIIFLAQVVIISIIVVVLKKKLDRNLTELAIRQLGFLKMEKGSVNPAIILSHQKLADTYKNQITQLLKGPADSSAQIDFQVDAGILGGIVMKIGARQLDYSLKNRLQEAFGKKPSS